MANLRRKMELASTMFGGNQRGYSQATQAHQTRITAVAAADSVDGEVAIQLPDETIVTAPTLAPVAEGEDVIVELQNTKAVVVGKPGWGDALRREDMDIRADLEVAEDSITALVEATASSGGSADEEHSIALPTQAARLTDQKVYGAYAQDGTPTPDNPSEIRTVESPVVCDYFRHAADDSEFWRNYTAAQITQLEDGWVRISRTHTAGASAAWVNVIPDAQAWVDPTKQYTMLVEYRHLTADGYALVQNSASNDSQLSCDPVYLVPNEEGASATDESGVATRPMLYRTTFSGTQLADTRVGLGGSATSLTVELRISIIEDYGGWGYLPEDAIGIALDRPNILRNADTCPELSASSMDEWSRGEWSSRSTGNGTRAAVDIADPPVPGITRGYQITGHTSGSTDVGQSGVPLEKGKSYQLSCWARCLTPDATTRLQIRVYFMNAATSLSSALFTSTSGSLDGTWRRVTATFDYTGDINPDGKPMMVLFGITNNASPDIQMCGFRVFDHVGTIPIDLDGNELASLPNGTRDVLTVDDAGAVTLEDRIVFCEFNADDVTWEQNGSSVQCAKPSAIPAWLAWANSMSNVLGVGSASSNTNKLMFKDPNGSALDLTAWQAAVAGKKIQVLAYKAGVTEQTINLGTVELPDLPDEDLVWSIAAAIPASGEASWLTYFGVMAGGDYASKAELAITEGQIRSDVAETYTTKGETQEVSTRVTQNSNNITSLITDVDGVQTMIREYSGGVLVGKPPSSGTTSVCALVNANGSFDVVLVTWAQVDGEWEPQSYTVQSTHDVGGMVVYDGNGTADANKIAEFIASGISFLGGIGKITSKQIANVGTALEIMSGGVESDDAFSYIRLSDNGYINLFSYGANAAYGSNITTIYENNQTVGWSIGGKEKLQLWAGSTSSGYTPILVNGKDLADFPTEYRVASLGEAIPNVSAKPSESARVLGWSYQKYASGLAHMWGVMPFNGAVATERGSMYMSAADLCSAFPFDVSRILSFQFGQGFASDYTWGLTAWPHLSTAIWQAGNHWGINWRAAAPLSGTYGGYIPVDVWAYVG